MVGRWAARRWWGVATMVLAVIALLAAARSAFTMVYLGVAFRNQIDPIRTPASYYFYVDGGRGLLTSGAVALAVATLAVLFGMAHAGVRMAGRPTVLFAVWAGCMLLAAIFPTDDSPRIETVAGWVHQFAGAGILAMLSFAGLAAAPRLAESPPWRPVVGIVRVLSIGAALLATAYVVTRVVQLVPALVVLTGGMDVGGILQRLVFAFDTATVTALAVHLIRVSWPALLNRTTTACDPSAPIGS